MLSKLKLILVGAAILILGAYLGRITSPIEVFEKEKIVYKERSQTETKTDRRETRIEYPNGIREIIIEEGVTESALVERDFLAEKLRKLSKTKRYNVALYALKTDSRGFDNPAYGVHAQSEVLPGISVGVLGSTDKSYGVSVGFSF